MRPTTARKRARRYARRTPRQWWVQYRGTAGRWSIEAESGAGAGVNWLGVARAIDYQPTPRQLERLTRKPARYGWAPRTPDEKLADAYGYYGATLDWGYR